MVSEPHLSHYLDHPGYMGTLVTDVATALLDKHTVQMERLMNIQADGFRCLIVQR